MSASVAGRMVPCQAGLFGWESLSSLSSGSTVAMRWSALGSLRSTALVRAPAAPTSLAAGTFALSGDSGAGEVGGMSGRMFTPGPRIVHGLLTRGLISLYLLTSSGV